ncbi:hypothetical protein P7266_0942 [Lactococcus cremoris]|nr:hypothetical protein P7266_0942 [Lactococcus cremoris]
MVKARENMRKSLEVTDRLVSNFRSEFLSYFSQLWLFCLKKIKHKESFSCD